MASLKEEVNNYVDLKTAELSNDLRQLREETERRVTETNRAVGNVVTAGTNLEKQLQKAESEMKQRMTKTGKDLDWVEKKVPGRIEKVTQSLEPDGRGLERFR